MGRTDSHAGFALQLRLLGRRGLATLLCLLRRWAGNLKPGAASVGPEVHHRIRRRNRALQEELRQVFAPLHRLCPECGSQCCREVEIPFSRLDGLLYGWRREGSPAQSGEKVPTVLSCLRRDYLYEKLKKFSRGSRTQPGGWRLGRTARHFSVRRWGKAAACSLGASARPFVFSVPVPSSWRRCLGGTMGVISGPAPGTWPTWPGRWQNSGSVEAGWLFAMVNERPFQHGHSE